MDEPSATEWLVEPVQKILFASIDRDTERIVEELRFIGTTGGSRAMFSACVALATAGGHMSGMAEAIADGDGMVALETIDKPGGGDVDEYGPGMFAARFFTCVVNKDIATAEALFAASVNQPDPDHHIECIGELIAMVGAMGRFKMAERDRDAARNQADNN